MQHPARRLLLCSLFSLQLLAGQVCAEGLVQLSFHGRVELDGGARVELEVGARAEPGGEVVPLQLSVHLARGTSAADLVVLLADRMQRSGMGVVSSPPSEDPTVATLFLERACWVHTRLGGGLGGAITLCEEAPGSVRCLPPAVGATPATLTVGLSSYSQGTRRHVQATLEVLLAGDVTPFSISEQLAARGIEAGWACERPTLDTWRVRQLLDGGRVTGTSIELKGGSSWRVEVELVRDGN